MARPRLVVLVAGTGTEVGKTWVGARLAEGLVAAGRSVAARKPAQSFDAGDDDTGATDAQVLAAATGEDATTVCPAHRWYPVALAPPMAADVLGRPPVRLADLLAELTWPEPAPDVGIVEPAGGVRSPLAEDGDTVALVAAVRPDLVVIVADAGLGTINAVHLTATALTGDRLGGDRLVVVLNRYDHGDDLHRRNAAWLRERLGLRTVTAVDELVELVDAAAPNRR